MNAKPTNKKRKPVFARLPPGLTQEQIVWRLVEVLERSGIEVKRDMDIGPDEDRNDD
jgi:hypothetical protein